MKALFILQDANTNAISDCKRNIESLRKIRSLNFSGQGKANRLVFKKSQDTSRITFFNPHFHRRNICG